MSDNRRIHERFRLWFAVQLDTGAHGDGAMGISHNASQGGILIACGKPLAVGTEVAVTFKVHPTDSAERREVGRIVRIDENTEDPFGLWPHRIAVEFKHPVAELEGVLRRATKPSGS